MDIWLRCALGPGDVGGGGEVFAKLKLGRVQVSKIVNETGLSISPSLLGRFILMQSDIFHETSSILVAFSPKELISIKK